MKTTTYNYLPQTGTDNWWMPNGMIITYMEIFMFPKLCNNVFGTVRQETHNAWFPLQRRWDLHSSGILRNVHWWFYADVLGQPISPTFKGQEVQDFLPSWPLKTGPISWPKHRHRITTVCSIISQKSADLKKHTVDVSEGECCYNWLIN
jgi:hypothetical protein